MHIKIDDLTGSEIQQLLGEHLTDMKRTSPAESVHALDLEGLRKPEITFWTAWNERELLGCGALKELNPVHGEIKSMHTASTQRHEGVASGLLSYMLEEAKRRKYTRVSLETGSMDFFAPARNLYAKFGFKRCGPFADYVEDPKRLHDKGTVKPPEGQPQEPHPTDLCRTVIGFYPKFIFSACKRVNFFTGQLETSSDQLKQLGN